MRPEHVDQMIIRHIRMDAPETQNSLDCDGHAALFPN